MAPNVRLVASLLLVDLGILVLALGHFVRFDDTSGFGSKQWNLPLGILAGGLGVASVVVALGDRRARRALGAVFVGGAAVLLVLQVTVDGFRFVWAGDEFELFAFDVVLGCLGLLLLASGLHRPAVEAEPGRTEPAPLSWTVRALLYLALTIALVLVAGLLGSSYGDAQCTGEGDDCPEAIIFSFLYAVGALVAMLVVVATCEITLRSRRRRIPA